MHLLPDVPLPGRIGNLTDLLDGGASCIPSLEEL
jgi:hypothetical protein